MKQDIKNCPVYKEEFEDIMKRLFIKPTIMDYELEDWLSKVYNDEDSKTITDYLKKYEYIYESKTVFNKFQVLITPNEYDLIKQNRDNFAENKNETEDNFVVENKDKNQFKNIKLLDNEGKELLEEESERLIKLLNNSVYGSSDSSVIINIGKNDVEQCLCDGTLKTQIFDIEKDNPIDFNQENMVICIIEAKATTPLDSIFKNFVNKKTNRLSISVQMNNDIASDCRVNLFYN